MTRNLERELREMGVEDDEEEYRLLEKRDAAHQEEACYRCYTKDLQDFLAWKLKNKPNKRKQLNEETDTN